MKASTKKLLNEQIKIILKELEQVEDVADRVELRIEAIEAIYKISCHEVDDIVPQGKESIKEDKAKAPVVIDEPEEVEEEIEDELDEVLEQEVGDAEPEEVSMDEVIESGQNLDPEVAAEQAMNLEEEEIVEVPVEENNEPIIVNGVDVTEAYNLLNPEISADFREEAAAQIMEYGTVNTYKTLTFINETDDEIISYKNLLAYYIDTWGQDSVEYYINYFGGNIDTDEHDEEIYVGDELHIDFLNENNIKGFCDYIEAIMEDEE